MGASSPERNRVELVETAMEITATAMRLQQTDLGEIKDYSALAQEVTDLH